MNDSNDYPQVCVINGVRLHLVDENRWLRRFKSKEGQWHVTSRILDGSFDYSLLDTLSVESLSDREKEDAGLAFCTAGCKTLPAQWQALADDYRARNYK